MTLVNLNDNSLLQRFEKLVRTERKITHLVLECIAEIDRRKLYLDKAYPSLFEYLTEAHGYSAGAAQRRISAARLLIEVPEVAQKIEEGQINLSQISLLAQTVKASEKKFAVKMEPETKLELLKQIENQSFADTQRILAQELKVEMKTPERRQFHADGSVSLTLNFTQEQYADWVRAGELASHAVPTQNAADVAHYLAKQEIRRRTEVRRPSQSAAKKTMRMTPQNQSAPVTRASESEVPRKRAKDQMTSKSEVLLKAGAHNATSRSEFERSLGKDRAVPDSEGQRKPNLDKMTSESEVATPPTPRKNSSHNPRQIQPNLRKSLLSKSGCRYRDPHTGKTCGSRRYLQIDHIHPVSDGGTRDPRNLRVLCGAHNRYRFRPTAH